MANCIKLKLPGLDERDVQKTKRQQLILLLLVVLSLFNTITSNINTTTVITITIAPKGMKVKFSIKLKISLYAGCQRHVTATSQERFGGELTKRKYLHPMATASTHATAIVTIITSSITTTTTKAQASTINFTAAIKTKLN